MVRIAACKREIAFWFADHDGEFEHVHGDVPHPLFYVGDRGIDLARTSVRVGGDTDALRAQPVSDQCIGVGIVVGELLDMHGLQCREIGGRIGVGGSPVDCTSGPQSDDHAEQEKEFQYLVHGVMPADPTRNN
ncbi:hypothetical protein ebA1715 [Aromatoleum aromaticum EbN1]|uniref:Uncharacterized protein n=1 Tax=Aromatoleum aromaticum (strain DSM 19018 / LMG 30748 / EbN1) TaxID=76114 RepID=Q5P6L0_AROAE|nr:hypothetical protein ebA1715 [Aromatoleum aromaticum EbN1]